MLLPIASVGRLTSKAVKPYTQLRIVKTTVEQQLNSTLLSRCV